MKKRLARQDTEFAINSGSNNETSVKITNDISSLFCSERPITTKSKMSVSFNIYKKDFVESAIAIISSLPLYKNGVLVRYNYDLVNTLLSDIEQFFGSVEKKEYNVELVLNNDRLDCIQGFSNNKFNIRSYFVENWTTLDFIKEGANVDMRVLLSKDVNVSNVSIKNSFQEIYYGAPGTGKSHVVKTRTKNESIVRTTFHPDSDYSTFVGCYKPSTKEVDVRDVTGKVIVENGHPVKEDRIIYEFRDQAFLQAYIQAWKFYANTIENSEPKKQYLIIEEINRGNCAQIFGDLFQLLDRNDKGFSDYYINADNDIQKHLKKAFENISIIDSLKESINSMYHNSQIDVVDMLLKGEILLLPNNLYIWATMNTSDQSLFPIDSAFKRRWDWKYMPITKGRDKEGKEINWIIKTETAEYDWWDFLVKINDKIGYITSSEDKKLGFFFCKSIDGIIDAETFVGKVIFYLWNDVFKNYGFDDEIFKGKDEKIMVFDKFYSTNEDGETIVVESKIDEFLGNLKVNYIIEIIDEVVAPNKTITINGDSVSKINSIPYKTIEKYIELNKDKSAQEIINYWKDYSRYSIRKWIICNRAERDALSAREAKYSQELVCRDGESVWVNKDGWMHDPNKQRDTIAEFIEAVHKANIGINIVEETI